VESPRLQQAKHATSAKHLVDWDWFADFVMARALLVKKLPDKITQKRLVYSLSFVYLI